MTKGYRAMNCSYEIATSEYLLAMTNNRQNTARVKTRYSKTRRLNLSFFHFNISYH